MLAQYLLKPHAAGRINMKFALKDRVKFLPPQAQGEGTVVSVDEKDDLYPYRVLADGGAISCYYSEFELELIEDKEEK